MKLNFLKFFTLLKLVLENCPFDTPIKGINMFKQINVHLAFSHLGLSDFRCANLLGTEKRICFDLQFEMGCSFLKVDFI